MKSPSPGWWFGLGGLKVGWCFPIGFENNEGSDPQITKPNHESNAPVLRHQFKEVIKRDYRATLLGPYLAHSRQVVVWTWRGAGRARPCDCRASRFHILSVFLAFMRVPLLLFNKESSPDHTRSTKRPKLRTLSPHQIHQTVQTNRERGRLFINDFETPPTG